jgi:tetratricopeptide (TPR) repeat protein
MVLGLTVLGGYLINPSVPDGSGSVVMDPSVHPVLDDELSRRTHQSFQQAVSMLQTGEFDYAVTALHDVLAVYPALPEAHVNMGFALLGLGDSESAADFFDSASDLRPTLHNAYYGLALAEIENGNDKSALAAMQAYAHLATEGDRHLPGALDVIWDLQARLEEASQ